MEKQVKKIWILNHHAALPTYGAGTRHFDFAQELAKRGYEVTVFASSHIHYTDINLLNEKERYKLADTENIKWVLIRTDSYRGNGLQRIKGMIQYYFRVLSVSKRFAPPDLIIGSAVHLLACLAAYRISRRHRIRFMSEIRDLWPETLIQMGRLKRGSLIAKGMSFLEDYIYRKSERIIATQPGMRIYMEGRGVPPGKIVYINNGVNVKDFNENAEKNFPEDKDMLLTEEKFNVVYVGGHGLVNDLETLVACAATLQARGLKQVHFFSIGEGPNKKALMETAKSKGLCNITFVDLLPKQCIPKILRKADALVFLGKNSELYQYGTSANKIFDYLCAGTPILYALKVPNDYVKETGCGISLEPENPEALAEAVSALLNMPENVRKEMGQKGMAFVKKNFDIPVLVDILESVLNEPQMGRE